MLYIPTIGVLKVHAAMIGENRKLTFEVPYFCSKNTPIRIAADRASTTAGILDERSMSSQRVIREIMFVTNQHLLSYLRLLTEGNGPLSPSIADNTETT